MTTTKLLIAFSFTGLVSCGQSTLKHEVDPSAIRLNNQAMTLIPFIDNPDSSQKAIKLLDQATTIDTNYFLGYANKLMFYYQLHQFDKALLTNNKLIQLRPTAHDLYLRSGMLYSQIGDATKAKTYFTKALTICNSVLDTMTKTNRDFVMLTTNKAITLIMLGDTTKANKILKVLYDNQPDDPDFGNVEKKYIQSLMNKNSKELIELLNRPDKYSR
ncbi:MAG: tetratricopeptide repeat protein [Verrucomicrobia bacterium]|nr:tetratricopeptide repeat protein [Verrucomicrobiota bacterium]